MIWATVRGVIHLTDRDFGLALIMFLVFGIGIAITGVSIQGISVYEVVCEQLREHCKEIGGDFSTLRCFKDGKEVDLEEGES